MLRPRPVTLALLVAIAVGFRLMPYLLHSLGCTHRPGKHRLPLEFLADTAAVHFRRRLLRETQCCLPGATGDLPGGRPGHLGDFRPGRLGLLRRSTGHLSLRDPGRQLRLHCPLAALLGADRGGRTRFGSPVLRRLEFRHLDAGRDLREDLGRTGGVLRDGDSVLPQHRDQHGVFLPLLFSRLALRNPAPVAAVRTA